MTKNFPYLAGDTKCNSNNTTVYQKLWRTKEMIQYLPSAEKKNPANLKFYIQ